MSRRGGITGTVRKVRDLLREILYPEGALCLNCGKISDGNTLCPGCRQDLREGDLLESWETGEVSGVPFWSMRPHRGISRTLILRLKHGAESRAAAELASILRTRPAYFPELSPDTVVTWVPGPKERILERGVDHGKLLAEAAAQELGLSCRPLLIRRGNDRPQARLKEEQRRQNLKNAFLPAGRISFPVLLVDDVLTTGTTASRCIEALRQGGAADIMVLTATKATSSKS